MIRQLYYPFNNTIPYIHNQIIITPLRLGDWVEDLGTGNIYQLQVLPQNTTTLIKLLLIQGTFWSEFGHIRGVLTSDN